MKIEDALRELPVGPQAKRLRRLLPAIEAKLAEGVPHSEVLALLNRSGFALKEGTYKMYLYRYRKQGGSGRLGSRTRWIATPPAVSSAGDSSPPRVST